MPSRSTPAPRDSILRSKPTGVGPGDEVIVPTMTFAATAEVVTYLGAVPVLVDCQRDTVQH